MEHDDERPNRWQRRGSGSVPNRSAVSGRPDNRSHRFPLRRAARHCRVRVAIQWAQGRQHSGRGCDRRKLRPGCGADERLRGELTGRGNLSRVDRGLLGEDLGQDVLARRGRDEHEAHAPVEDVDGEAPGQSGLAWRNRVTVARVTQARSGVPLPRTGTPPDRFAWANPRCRPRPGAVDRPRVPRPAIAAPLRPPSERRVSDRAR